MPQMTRRVPSMHSAHSPNQRSLELVGVVSEEADEQVAEGGPAAGGAARHAVVLGHGADGLTRPELVATHPLQVRQHRRTHAACRANAALEVTHTAAREQASVINPLTKGKLDAPHAKIDFVALKRKCQKTMATPALRLSDRKGIWWLQLWFQGTERSQLPARFRRKLRIIGA